MSRIQITVVSRYLPEQSEPDRHVFAYTIRLRNVGVETAQLLRRYWRITDANGEVEEVRGDGVVGEQPSIAPGGEYEYTSGAILETEVGAMEGHYEFRLASGETFKAPIAAFSLRMPNSVH
ncbi:MAG: Co2+/Mg2+ efflux protein ApaG [Pseudomonadaceae bacterium]|nr:Co2+/Mg2+ efflux protein ApaG [Pseudomonadaceae bacterium]